MTNQPFSSFTDGGTPTGGQFLAGYNTAVVGGNRRWTFANLATYVKTAISSTSIASGVVARDANQNVFFNNFATGLTNVASAAGTTVLTAASTRIQRLTGVTTQTYQLPDATTLAVNEAFEFDNASTGILTIVDNASGGVTTIPGGGYAIVRPLTIGTAAGTWNIRFMMPSNANYGTAGMTITGTLNTSGANTWNTAQRGAFSTLTDASTVTADLSLANQYNLVLGGNRTLGVPTNIGAGQTGVINVRQDITGTRTLAYAWVFEFPGGVTPTLSTGKLVFDSLSYVVNYYSTATVTVTIATPGVMTWTAHGLQSGQKLQLTTTGALPTGLTASTTYWITKIDANTFNLSTSLANAQTATFIATSGSQSGVHTAVAASITIGTNLAVA